MDRACDDNCNECPVISHPNSRVLTQILNKLHDGFGNGVYRIVQDMCPNFTVCYDCRIDDFCHSEECVLVEKMEKQYKEPEMKAGAITLMAAIINYHQINGLEQLPDNAVIFIVQAIEKALKETYRLGSERPQDSGSD